MMLAMWPDPRALTVCTGIAGKAGSPFWSTPFQTMTDVITHTINANPDNAGITCFTHVTLNDKSLLTAGSAICDSHS